MNEATSPHAQPPFAAPGVIVRRQGDGGLLLSSPYELEPYPSSLGALLEGWASRDSERIFLAERDAADDDRWRKLTYGDALRRVRGLGQALLDHGLSAERPLVLLSGNGIDHALLQLAAMYVGVPAVPVSTAYSLMSRDLERLRYIVDLVRPGMIFAVDGEAFHRALAAVAGSGAARVVSGGRTGDEALLSELMTTAPRSELSAAAARVGPDTLAKILFTSGSTGIPKGVINTQRMLCSNQQAIVQLWPFLRQRPPILVDWLPWSHTFGGNHNFNMVLMNGGTLYIDGGKPMPGAVELTVGNLRDLSPTLYFNVPRGFAMLIPYLEKDAALRQRFFARLDLIFYAAASLPASLWQRLAQLSLAARGERVSMVSAWGSTETAPLATSVHFAIERAGVIGLPAPGCELKLVPSGSKYEMRVRGPNVTPGYWRRDDLTAQAFDEEGFFLTGDAGRLADTEEPRRGLVFDGRIAENFKLMSGTWVDVGQVRIQVISAGEPVIQDVVVAGHDRDAIGLLIFPSLDGCRELCAEATTAELRELVVRQEVRQHLQTALTAYNQACPGNSQRISRALLMSEPPSIDANEITDKGYINQRAVLERRAYLVAELFSDISREALRFD